MLSGKLASLFYPWLEFVRSAVLLIRRLTPSLPHGAAVVGSFKKDAPRASTLLLLLGSWKFFSHLTYCFLVAMAPDPPSLNMLRHAKTFCLDLVLVSCNAVLSLDSTNSILRLHGLFFLSSVDNNCQNDYCWILLPKSQAGLCFCTTFRL